MGEYGRPQFPVAQLNVQRRMRPQISILIRDTLYERLTDHDDVKNLPNVVGMRKNVFWYDHTNPEDSSTSEANQRSKSNAWEVEITHALVRHMVRQGVYDSKDIAVLTPYSGQLQKLRAAMRNDFEIVLSERDEEKLAKHGLLDEEETWESDSDQARGLSIQKKAMIELLRVATVDNFQGEEAKIVIISLVRSNAEKKVGFLKTTNRINVLLSRAQHGMYLIGNARTYSNIPMWSQVLGMLRANDSVEEALDICCPRHPETEILVHQPGDFAILSPEGGCRKPCDRLDIPKPLSIRVLTFCVSKRLNDCGHRCLTKCHSDAMHQIFKCSQACERLFIPCNHGCPKDCGDACGVYNTQVGDLMLPCSHIKDQLRCHQSHDLSMVMCNVTVRKKVPGCNYIVDVPCHRHVESDLFRCPEPCAVNLTCGHRCQGTCGSCNSRAIGDRPATVEHRKCAKICGRRHGTCNYICERKCHGGDDCGLCFSSCEVNTFFTLLHYPYSFRYTLVPSMPYRTRAKQG
jgi:hypothetical protein